MAALRDDLAARERDLAEAELAQAALSEALAAQRAIIEGARRGASSRLTARMRGLIDLIAARLRRNGR